MTMIRSGFADVLDPVFRKIYDMELKLWKPVHTEIFNVEKTDRKEVKDSFVTPLGALEVKTEGEAITYRDMTQGYDYTYTMITFAGGAIVTLEMYQDDQHRIMKKIPALLTRSRNYTKELEGANILNYGFTDSAAYRFGDSKPLFSASHPNPTGGSVISNLLSTASDLSATSLKQMLIDWDNQVDYNGFPINIPVKYLWHPNDLRFDVIELLKSQQLAGGALNNINSISDAGLTPLRWSYLTDADAWGLLSDKANHGLNLFDRMAPTMRNFDDPDSWNMKTSIVERYDFGVSHFWGVMGTPGA